MTAHLAIVRNPFHPLQGRELREIVAGPPLAACAPKTERPFILLKNGQAVLRKDWQIPIGDNDLIAVVYLPRGGDGGSNPLKLVLMIAVAVYAPVMAEAMLGTETAAIGLSAIGMSSQTFVAIATAGINMVGSALINAAFGTPSTTSSLKTASLAAPSPTYSLQAQGNMARLDAAIPVQYGRMMCYPDFAAQPYIEYAGNEQYLYQLLCIGAGEYDIEAVRIEDTSITNFEEITQEVIGPHGTVTLFPTNVDSSAEVSGQEMEYNVYLGPFTANAAGTAANALGIDIVFARGLYYANDGGGLDPVTITWTVEAREIDDVGAPVGAGTYSTLGSESYSAATTTPQRLSKRYSVTAARYEVRVKRTSTKSTDSRYGNDIAWAGLRTYLHETLDFGDVTLLALRMRASNNLSMQASRKINVIATRKLPAWSGSAFGTASATRSIAWALANACTDATWGAGLPEARVDLDGLLALDAIWTARGDHFDGRFDSAISFWEAITKIARAGRAFPYMQGGVVRFARDAAETTPVALFSMRNIVRGSFSVQYLTPHEAMADAIDVAYFDGSVWAPRRVQAKLSGSTAAKPVKIDTFGITDRDHAWREGMYEAACNRYRRKLIKFSTDMEGFIPSYGDLIAVAHDMPQWGQTAEVTAYALGNNSLKYSAQFDQATWVKTRSSIVANATIAPNGEQAADKFVLDSTAASTHYTYINNTPIIANGIHTFSVYAKAGELSRLRLSTQAGTYDAASTASCTFNLTTGAIMFLSDTYGLIVSTSIEDAGDGWWRCRISAHIDATSTAGDFLIVLCNAAGSVTVDGDGVSGLYIFGAQVEEGATHGAYVPTTTAARSSVPVLTLTESPVWATGTHYVGLRKRNGSIDGPIACELGAAANQIVLGGTPAETPYTGQAAERTHLVFGAGETWRQPARVIAVRPRGLEQVEIECINEDASVHTADSSGTAPAVIYSQLDTRWTAPIVEDLTAWSMPGAPEQMLLSWRPAPGADHYLIEQSSDGETWTRTGEPSASSYTAIALYGAATMIRVAAVGMTRGPWVVIGYGGFADYMWNAADTTLMWSATSTDLMWRY